MVGERDWCMKWGFVCSCSKALTHRICVWYIYLHESLIFMVNVAKYTNIHGSYGKGTWALLLLKGYKLYKPSLSLNHPRS